jgi:hypothetical protein
MASIIAAQLLELEHQSIAEAGDGMKDFTGSISAEVSTVLDEEYYDFRSKVDSILIEMEMGDSCPEDFFGDKVAFYFLCVRNGHGCSFTDDFWREGPERTLAERMNTLARDYGQLYPYVGDDGMVYVSGYEHLAK